MLDYRPIITLTVVDWYLLQRIDKMLDCVGDAVYFSKLDLHSGFHKIMVFPEHVKRTAFRTKYSTFVYQVMPFGPCNALRHFRRSWSIFSKTGSNSLELTSTTSWSTPWPWKTTNRSCVRSTTSYGKSVSLSDTMNAAGHNHKSHIVDFSLADMTSGLSQWSCWQFDTGPHQVALQKYDVS